MSEPQLRVLFINDTSRNGGPGKTLLDIVKFLDPARIHRSVLLSPLGADFCQVCLPLDLADIPRQLNPGSSE